MIPGSFIRTQLAQQTPFDNTSNGFVSTNVQEAIEEVKAKASAQRFTIMLSKKGAMPNNQRFPYADGFDATPVIIPRNCILREITFSNKRENCDARFDIYRRPIPLSTGVPGPTAILLQSWIFTDVNNTLLTGLSYSFSQGEEILFFHIDTGDSPDDGAILCFFESIS